MSVKTTNTPELTAEQVAKILIEPLQAESKFLAAGPRIFDTTGPFRIPKNGGPITDPGWTGESEQIPERDADFDEIELLPSTMKSVKVITRYSNEMARSSVVALDSALKSRLVRDVAAKLDRQFFGAGGDGVTTPQGMFGWSGTQTHPVGDALGIDDLIESWGLALRADVNVNNLRWVFKPREVVRLHQIVDADQRLMLTPDPTQPARQALFGVPILVTDRIPDTNGGTPTGRAALVDFSQIAVARDMAPSITVLRERYADFDEQALRVVARYDLKPMNPQAVVTLTGITV